MIRSMTGYGKGEATVDGVGRAVVELKSLNHRFTELIIRLPKGLAQLEDRIRRMVLYKMARGRVEVTVSVEYLGARKRRVFVDKELAIAYYNALEDLEASLGTKTSIDVGLIAGFPEIFSVEEGEADLEGCWSVIEPALCNALDDLLGMKEREGLAIRRDFGEKLAAIRQALEVVRQRAGGVVEEYRRRLRARLEEFLSGSGVEEERLALEAALYAERSDITEELTRLDSHLEQFESALQNPPPVGRKLEFILQEIHREINTVASKALDMAISQAVVEIKTELEKLREQAQNVE